MASNPSEKANQAGGSVPCQWDVQFTSEALEDILKPLINVVAHGN